MARVSNDLTGRRIRYSSREGVVLHKCNHPSGRNSTYGDSGYWTIRFDDGCETCKCEEDFTILFDKGYVDKVKKDLGVEL